MTKETGPVYKRILTSEYSIVALVLLFASALILANLGNIYMWSDEAQTALVARTILTHGIPLGTDGLNYYSTEQKAEYGKDFTWRWHPWLPFYVLAGFFALFGQSTFVCRLPFALFGIATVLIAYYFGRSLWKSRRAGVMAVLLLASSVPMLLLVRQCRYYSPAAFFSLAGLYAYWEMLKGRKYATTAFAVSAFLLFHSFYTYVPGLLAAALVHSALYRRDKLKPVLLISVAVVAVNVPWMVYFSHVGHAPHVEPNPFIRSRVIGARLAVQFVNHVFPPWLLVIPVIVAAVKRLRREPVQYRDSETFGKLVLLLAFTAVTLIVLAPTAPDGFLRYLAPLIPIFCLVTALMLDSAMKLHWSIGILVLVLLAARENMAGYLYEIRHDYDGPVEGTVLYLNEHAKPGDVVAVNREPLPLMFYTKLRVISGVSGEDISPARQADWIIMRKYIAGSERKITDLLLNTTLQQSYEPIPIYYPDLPTENRESPEDHYFRTVEDADNIVIFHRPQDSPKSPQP